MSTQWESAGTFQQPPTGPHTAVLVRIIDIGTQESEFKGEKTIRRQNILTWELPFELMEDGQPFIFSKFYTASLSEKATLAKDLTSWLGKAPAVPFDPKSLLGKGCQIVISEREGSDKLKVSAVVGLAKGTEVPKKTHNPLVFFSLDEYDESVYDNLSEGIQKMIAKSPEFAKIMNPETEEKAESADIPF